MSRGGPNAPRLAALTAQEAADAFVAAGHGPVEDFRVKRTKAPAD